MKSFIAKTTHMYNQINAIRTKRNEIIKKFLNENYLIEFVEARYPNTKLSPQMIQLTINELMESLITPVDLKHYQVMLDGKESFVESNGTPDLESFEQLFYDDVLLIIDRRIHSSRS